MSKSNLSSRDSSSTTSSNEQYKTQKPLRLGIPGEKDGPGESSKHADVTSHTNAEFDEPDEPETTRIDKSALSKYTQAGAIANYVLKEVIEKCVDGASSREVSIFGDELIIEECRKVFKKEKNLERGIAFPTCVSANNCICNFSPIKGEPDYILKNEDVVKIDLGAHIDGFIAVVAHTIIVGASPTEKITGRKADVFLAAYHASQAALRLLKPNTDTYTVTDTVEKVCREYGCNAVKGMLSHQLTKFRIDGPKLIFQSPTKAQKNHKKFEIQEFEVYAMNVLISSGTGLGRVQNAKPSIYKQTEKVRRLDSKSSRVFYTEVVTKFGNLPFNIRYFKKKNATKIGLKECLKQHLLNPFEVLYENLGEFVVQFKFTAIVLPRGPAKIISGLQFDPSLFESERAICDPKIGVLLKAPVKRKSSNKKRKQAKCAKVANNSNEEETMDIGSNNSINRMAPTVNMELDVVKFKKLLYPTVEYLCHMVKEYEQNRPSAQPLSAESRFLALLQYVFVKMLSAQNVDELGEENGWPVPFIYNGIPRTHCHVGFIFELTILKDSRSFYFLVDFDVASFHLFEITHSAIPAFKNLEVEVNRFIAIKNKIHKYLKKFKREKVLPEVSAHEKTFLSMRIYTAAELAKVTHAAKITSYEGFETIGIDSNLSSLNRLYRSILYLFHCSGCWSPGSRDDWTINLLPQYEDQLIHLYYIKKYFYVSILTGRNEFFLILRDCEKEYLYGYRIPERAIITCKNDRVNIVNDNLRIEETVKFLNSVLEDVQMPNRLRLRSTTITDSTNAQKDAHVDEDFINV